MNYLKKLKLLIMVPMFGLAMSCTQEEVAPASAQLPESENMRLIITENCNETRTVWADTPYQNSITIDAYGSKRFYTNQVCGATSYTWTVDDQASMTTSTPYVDLQGNYLVWLPPGGCKDFNKKWTSDNPFFNKENPSAWPGGIPYGTYKSKIKVKANNSSRYVELPVNVTSVEFCREEKPGSGLGGGKGGGFGG